MQSFWRKKTWEVLTRHQAQAKLFPLPYNADQQLESFGFVRHSVLNTEIIVV